MKIILFLIIFFSTGLFASIGNIISLEGKASILRDGKIIMAAIGQEIEKKDVVSTDSNSKIRITFNDKTIVSLGKDAILNIEEYVYDIEKANNASTELNFVKGAFHTITGQIGKINPSKFKLKTKSATIGIRGTEIYGNQEQVACTKGAIDITSFGVTYIVPAGNFVETFTDKVPSLPKVLDDDSLNKIKTKLETVKTSKTVSFTTKNSVSKDGTTSANAKNGTVTVNKDGIVTYTPKSGFEGEDTLVITKENGDETTTETITIKVFNNLDIPNEINLESITTTSLAELANAALINDNDVSKSEVSQPNNDSNPLINDVQEDKKEEVKKVPEDKEEEVIKIPEDKKEEVIKTLSLAEITINTIEDSSVTGVLITSSNVDDKAVLTYSTTQTVAGFTLKADGTYSFDAKDSAYDSLNKDEEKILIIPITVTDDAGISISSNLQIKVLGVSDAPILNAISNVQVNEGTKDLTSGKISASDVDNNSILTYSSNTTLPAGFTLKADGTYSFDAKDSAYDSLNKDEEKILIIPITVTDDAGISISSNLQIKVLGVSDAPILNAISNVQITEGVLHKQLIPLEANDIDNKSVLTYSTNQTVAGFSLNKDGTYSFDAKNSAYASLNKDEIQTVKIPIIVTDETGLFTTSNMLITIKGISNAPIFTLLPNVQVNEGATPLTNGKITASDVDNNSSLKFSSNTTLPAGFTLNTDGTFSFDAKNSAYDSLKRGETQTLNIPVVVTDETGVSTSSNLQIKVDGNTDLSGYQLGALVNTDENKIIEKNNFTIEAASKMNVYSDKVVLGEYSSKLKYFNKYYSSDIGVNTYINSSQESSSITALGSDKFIVTWTSYGQDGSYYGVYSQLFSSDGTKIGNEFLVNTYTNSSQENSSITALGSDKFIVTWTSSGQDGSSDGVYSQIFSIDGTKIGNEILVNTYTNNYQNNSTITNLGSDKFIITWSSYEQDGNNYGVYSQLFNNNGTKIGNEFLVNTYTNNWQDSSSITALGNDKFIVTWTSNGQDGNGSGVYSQIFSSNGTKIGNEFLVNTHTNDWQERSSITALGSDKFVVTWTSYGQDGSGSGVYSQIFSSNGIKIGNEILVNTYTNNYQNNSTITNLGNDKFIVTWSSYGQDGTSYGVYSQLFSSDGTKIGNEFLVNNYTNNSQDGSSITALGSDKFVVTWTSYGQDGSSDGVYSQIYIIKEDSVVKSGELTYASFDMSGYTSHSNIENIAYTQNINSSPYLETYALNSDNLEEFIVGSADETWTIDGEEHSYKDLFYNGLVSSKSVLDDTKTYTYLGYKSISVENKLGDTLSNVNLKDISSTKLAINPKTGSVSFYNYADGIEQIASKFNVAKINPDGTIIAKSYNYNLKNTDSIVSSESTIAGQIYGSEGQGIGLKGDIVDKQSTLVQVENEISLYSDPIPSDNTNVVAEDIEKTVKTSDTYYLNSINDNLSSGNTSFNGSSIAIHYDSNEIYSINYDTSFEINKDTGTFTNGVMSIDSIKPFAFNGNVDDLSSYYINDDNFGVKIQSTTNINEEVIENSSWMIAISDKLDSEGNFSENLDNESSWGYWTANVKDLNTNDIKNINAYSTWVAGIQTDPTYVQGLMESSTMKTLNFTGNVIGGVISRTGIDAIKFDDKNFMNMKFELGAEKNAFVGNFGFDTANSGLWNGAVAGKVTSSGFNGSEMSGSIEKLDGSAYIYNGSIEGNFFGTDSIKSVGGNMEINSSIGTAAGSFKADETEQDLDIQMPIVPEPS